MTWSLTKDVYVYTYASKGRTFFKRRWYISKNVCQTSKGLIHLNILCIFILIMSLLDLLINVLYVHFNANKLKPKYKTCLIKVTRACNVNSSECFLLSSPYTQIAILGDHHIWSHEGTEQYMSVDAIYWHQSYDYKTLDYDIMLMKLAHPVNVNQHVKPVSLPQSCPTAGDMCTVSGWGNIYSDQGNIFWSVCPSTYAYILYWGDGVCGGEGE